MSSSHVNVQLDNYAWLRAAWPAPEPSSDYEILSAGELADTVDVLPKGTKLSLDTETTGLRYWVPGFGMQSIAVYVPGSGALYAADTSKAPDEEKSHLLDALSHHKLYAFNLQFDGGVLYSVNEQLPKNWKIDPEQLLASFTACSQVLFRNGANEGFNVHSLEMAQKNFFGWEDSQKDWLKANLEAKGLGKHEMWRLMEHDDTRDGFLYYNAMDARSAWLVWEHLCNEAKRVEREGLISLHENEFGVLIRDCIRQAFTGIPLNRKKMREILIASFRKKAEIHTALRHDPRIKPFVDKWEAEKIAAQWQLDVEYRAKPLADSRIVVDALAGYGVADDQGEALPEEAAEETRAILSKAGAAVITPEGLLALPSYKISLKGGNKYPGFNFSSPDNLKDLLYGKLAKSELAYMKKMGQDELPRYRITYQGKSFVVAGTDSGELPTGADIYPIFGDIGKQLEAAAEADTRFGFAKSYLAAASETKRIHTQLKVHGAATGRCSGGSGGKGKGNLSVNLQQAPRSDKEFMECFTAPKGFVFLSNDFRGLEKVVQAELSGDPVLTQLYASGEQHDVHLYHTMRIHPDPAVRAAISERYELNQAVIDALKKEFKKERAFGKMASFAFDYGSGAENIQLKAAIEGIPVSLEDAEAARASYRALYKVYYAWCDEKAKEWEARGGWIEDGFGFPIAIAPYPVTNRGIPVALKDAGSRIVQRTGHYILLTWLKHIEALKRERKLWKLERPVICDLHDERIVLTPENRIDECLALHQEALDRTNDELSPKIRFEIASEFGPTLYDCKKG